MADKKEEKKDEKKEEAPNAEGAEAGSKKKLFIFAGIGALLLILAVGGTFMLLSKPKSTEKSTEKSAEKTDDKAAETKKEDEHSEKPAEDGHGKPEGDKKTEGASTAKPASKGNYGEAFVLKPFHMNLGNPLENRYLRLELSIEYRGGEAQKTELDNRTSQIRDIVVSISTRKTMEFLLGPDGKDQLRYEIFTRLNQVLDKKIEAVYITDILVE